jgi:hypothetical protein
MRSSRATALVRSTRKRRPALGRGASRGPLSAVTRPSWKLVGLAGIAGVAATGVVVARNRRAQRELPPDELRERLHERLAAISEAAPTRAASPPPAEAAAPAPPEAASPPAS